MEVEINRVINQPINRVFAHFADVEQRPVWLSTAAERVKIAEGPIGTGSKFRSTNQMPTGKRFEFNQEVTDYEPDERIAESWDGPLAGSMVATFKPIDGNTELTLRMELTPTGIFGIIGPLLKPKVKKDLGRDLATFEEWVAKDQ